MGATLSGMLKEIALNLKPLEALARSSFPQQLLIVFITAALSFFSAIFIALKIEDIKRKREKSNLKPLKVISCLQNNTYHFRLILKNDSDYVGKNVEFDIIEIYDDGKIRKNFIPSPLNWTHRSTEPRSIFPHQDVYLDLFSVSKDLDTNQSRRHDYITLSTPHLWGIKGIPTIYARTTKLALKYNQENGQSGLVNIQVKWNGKESYEEGLPEIKLLF